MVEEDVALGFQLVIGLLFLLAGIAFIAGAIVLIVLAIKKKKGFMYPLSVVAVLVSLPVSGIGIYLISDFVRYMVTFRI